MLRAGSPGRRPVPARGVTPSTAIADFPYPRLLFPLELVVEIADTRRRLSTNAFTTGRHDRRILPIVGVAEKPQHEFGDSVVVEFLLEQNWRSGIPPARRRSGATDEFQRCSLPARRTRLGSGSLRQPACFPSRRRWRRGRPHREARPRRVRRTATPQSPCSPKTPCTVMVCDSSRS